MVNEAEYKQHLDEKLGEDGYGNSEMEIKGKGMKQQHGRIRGLEKEK